MITTPSLTLRAPSTTSNTRSDWFYPYNSRCNSTPLFPSPSSTPSPPRPLAPVPTPLNHTYSPKPTAVSPPTSPASTIRATRFSPSQTSPAPPRPPRTPRNPLLDSTAPTSHETVPAHLTPTF